MKITRKSAFRALAALIATIPATLYGQQGTFLELNWGTLKPKPTQDTFIATTGFMIARGPEYEPGTGWVKLHLEAFSHVEIFNGKESIRITRDEFWQALKQPE